MPSVEMPFPQPPPLLSHKLNHRDRKRKRAHPEPSLLSGLPWNRETRRITPAPTALSRVIFTQHSKVQLGLQSCGQ